MNHMDKSHFFREITSLSEEDCFVIVSRSKTAFTFPVHVHAEYELNFIENAKGAQRIVGDSVEEIEDLELCLIGNEMLEHGWVDNKSFSKEVNEITIHFHNDLFLESLKKKQFQSMLDMFENAKKGIAFSSQAIKKVRPKLFKLTANKNSFYSVLDLIAILYELSQDRNYRILSSSDVIERNDASSICLIQKTIKYLELNFQKDLRITDLALYTNMSEASFSRFIKKRTGKNFVEYLNDIRLNIAIHYLVNTSKSISEIRFDCGFRNLSNFNRIFRKRKDCTPKEFRENNTKIKVFI